MYLQDFPIIYKKQIPFYLQNFRPFETVLSTAQINEISREIDNEQQSFNPFPLCSYFHIDHQDLTDRIYMSLLQSVTSTKEFEDMAL